MMGQRRMFSNRIANSARFLQMPVESQLLYFHMILRADDDGIVEAYPVMKLLGTAPDAMVVLLGRGYVRQLNEDQVVVIMDWNEHNTIRADRKVDSIYLPLLIKKYPEIPIIVPKPRSDVGDNTKRISGQSTDSPRTAQVKLSQVKLSKDKKEGTAGPPSLAEWIEYCKSKGYTFDFENAHAYYESNGWRQARGNKIKNWMAAAKTCQGRENERTVGKSTKRKADAEWFKGLVDKKTREVET